jgi:hypothetical protein
MALMGREAMVLLCVGCGIRQPAAEFALHERMYLDGDGHCAMCVERHRRQLARDAERVHGPPDASMPLIQCVRRSDFGSVVARLAAAPAEASKPDPRTGHTPLHEAVLAGAIELAALLLEAGASATARTFLAGESPMHLAAASGNKRMAEILLAHGARPDCRNRAGRTPLHAASTVALAHLLLREGADPAARDAAKDTPAAVASARGDAEMATFFDRLAQSRVRHAGLLAARSRAVDIQEREKLAAKRAILIHEREAGSSEGAAERIAREYAEWRSAGTRTNVVRGREKPVVVAQAAAAVSWVTGRPSSRATAGADPPGALTQQRPGAKNSSAAATPRAAGLAGFGRSGHARAGRGCLPQPAASSTHGPLPLPPTTAGLAAATHRMPHPVDGAVRGLGNRLPPITPLRKTKM